VNGGDAVLVVGTYGSIYVGVDHPTRDINGILTAKNNTGPENWTLEASAPASACSYRWFRDTFCSTERNIANEVPGIDAYNLINMEIDSVAPGAGGITFLPYLQGASGGARDNAHARGALMGMTLGTSKAQVARAVMEGITMEMRDNVEAMRRSNVEMKTIRLTGGATKSKSWNQMQADMYKTPVQILKTSETGCQGAALYAGIGAGIYKDYNEAVEIAVQIAETYDPNPSNYEAYDEAFERFTLCYNSLYKGGYF
ncbi:MAG: FGGY-family carbohydrate kinase, partial [Eubacterium sp.]